LRESMASTMALYMGVPGLPAPVGFDPSSCDVDDVVLPDESLGFDFGVSLDESPSPEEAQLAMMSSTLENFSSVVVVDCIPVVPREKQDKLLAVLGKIFRHPEIGSTVPDGIHMPVDANGTSKGFAIIEYVSPQSAQKAVESINGYRLDKNHVFSVFNLASAERLLAIPRTYEPPPSKPYTPTENLFSWLMDARGRDQFASRYSDQTEIFWNDAKATGKEEPVYQRQNWTESFVQWSPKGTCIATVHRQGAALWGGPEWARLQRFAHPNTRLIDFSPDEKYLVCFSLQEPSHPRESAQANLGFFDLRTGKKMRTFSGPAEDYGTSASSGVTSWPVFRWSGGEDRLFAKMGKNCVSVYECPSFGMCLNHDGEKKSYTAEALSDFRWSPSANIMALFQKEHGGGNAPARVSLVEFPSRKDIRQKALFSVAEAALNWHPQGTYLGVTVDRYTKTRKSTYTGFELFRVAEKDCPMEVLELQDKKARIICFAWEPKGHRFCIVSAPSEISGGRTTVDFYSMLTTDPKTGTVDRKVKHLTTLKSRQCNAVYWSPAGKHIVLAGLKSMNGQLEFYNVEELESMAQSEHFMCTDVDWDPTGRFISTSVTSVHQMENGYNLWSFSGKMLSRTPRDRFLQYLWRPRPPSLLGEKKEAEIAKNLKSYAKRYEDEDERLREKQDTNLASHRKRLMDEFKAWEKRIMERRAIEAKERRSLRGPNGYISDDEVEGTIEEEMEAEEVLEVREEVE